MSSTFAERDRRAAIAAERKPDGSSKGNSKAVDLDNREARLATADTAAAQAAQAAAAAALRTEMKKEGGAAGGSRSPDPRHRTLPSPVVPTRASGVRLL